MNTTITINSTPVTTEVQTSGGIIHTWVCPDCSTRIAGIEDVNGVFTVMCRLKGAGAADEADMFDLMGRVADAHHCEPPAELPNPLAGITTMTFDSRTGEVEVY